MRRFGGNATERRDVIREIDAVAAQMNVIAAGVARRRLKASNGIPERVKITSNGDELTIELDDRAYTATLGGAAVEVTGVHGNALRMSLKVVDGALEQRFVGDDGGRINRFTAHETKGVRVFVRVFSPRLPDDVRYALTYRPQ